MDLFQEIIIDLLSKGKIQITNIKEILENKAYRALEEIQKILQNNEYSDEDCFTKIENIICVYESLGSNGGDRHDF